MRRFLIAAVVLAMTSTLAACGDDDEAGGGGITKTAYTQQANNVCSRVTAELAQKFEEIGFPVVKSQVGGFVDQIAPIVERGMNDLSGIEPPEAEEANLRSFRDAARTVGEGFRKAAADDAEAEKLFQEEGGWQPLRDAAQGYGGMPACERIDEEEGDDPGEKVDVSTLPAEKRAYIERVDVLCRAADAEDDAVEAEVFGEGFPPTVDKWAVGLPRFVEIARRLVARIREVTPPEADRATIEGMLAEQQEVIAEVDRAAAVARAGDEQALAGVLGPLFPKFDELDAKLRQFGFQVCGSEDAEEEGGDGE